MRTKRKTVRKNLMFEPEEARQLDAIAKLESTNFSDLVRRSVLQFLAQQANKPMDIELPGASHET